MLALYIQSPTGEKLNSSKRHVLFFLYMSLWLAQAPEVFAEGLDAGGYLGLEYYLNDSSAYPPKIYETDYPSAILPLRGVLGGYAAIQLRQDWRLGARVQLTSLSGSGVLANGGNVYLSSLSVPLSMYVTFGTSPYVAGSIGYNLGISAGSFTNIRESSGLTEGLRLGWEGFYVSADAIVSPSGLKNPEYRIGFGYENFIRLVGDIKRQVERNLIR